MDGDIQAIIDQATQNENAEQAADNALVALFQALTAAINNAGSLSPADRATLQAKVKEMAASSATLAAAIVANSPSNANPPVATTVGVETAPDGSGVVVPAGNLASGATLSVFAVSRDASGKFVANVAAAFSESGATGGVVPGDLVQSSDGKSAILTGNAAGTTSISAAVNGLTSIPSGVITVGPAAAAAAKKGPVVTGA